MTRLRPIRSVLATLLVGGLLGFVVPGFVVGTDPGAAATTEAAETGETATARRFIVALLANDQDALSQVSLDPAAALEAARLGVTNTTVTSLTFLGSSQSGGLHLNSYAAEFTKSDGTKVLRGFRVATVGPFAFLDAPPEPAP